MSLRGGSVKRSLAIAFLGCGAAIAKAFGLDAATHFDSYFLVVRLVKGVGAYPYLGQYDYSRGSTTNTVALPSRTFI